MRVIPSKMEIPRFVLRNIKTNKVTASKIGKSNFKRLPSKFVVLITPPSPIGIKPSKILLPITFPTDIPTDFRMTAPIDTANSGKLVPIPTIIIPTKDCARPHFWASNMAFSTTCKKAAKLASNLYSKSAFALANNSLINTLYEVLNLTSLALNPQASMPYFLAK